MGYRLGVSLGQTFTAATIDGAGAEPNTAVVPSVVHVDLDEEVRFGSAAAELALTDPDGAVHAPVARVGEDTHLGPAAELVAETVVWIANRAAAGQGAAADSLTVAHPAVWNARTRAVLHDALTGAGLPQVRLIPEPVAVAAAAAAAGIGFAPGSVVAVYDLGGRSCDVTLIRSDSAGRWAPIAGSARSGAHGGLDADDAVFSHVLGLLTPTAGELIAAAEADAESAAAVLRLRGDCRRAKEALSTTASASIPVALPGIEANIRITRGELEDMLAAPLLATLDLMDASLAGAHVAPRELTAVLLSGGSTRIPLVTATLSRFARVPVRHATAQPAHAVSLGAAALPTDWARLLNAVPEAA